MGVQPADGRKKKKTGLPHDFLVPLNEHPHHGGGSLHSHIPQDRDARMVVRLAAAMGFCDGLTTASAMDFDAFNGFFHGFP